MGWRLAAGSNTTNCRFTIRLEKVTLHHIWTTTDCTPRYLGRCARCSRAYFSPS